MSTQRTGPLLITHLGQFPATTDLVQSRARRLAWRAPSMRSISRCGRSACRTAFSSTFQGAAAAFQASLTNELLLIIAAVVTMYIVLGVLYESFIHPDHDPLDPAIGWRWRAAGVDDCRATISTSSPSSASSLLIGIVKKNAIMMIDFALDAERNEGLTPREAIFQACLLRFRPILMTTMAAILGALPLMLGTGIGSELRTSARHRHRRRPDRQPGPDAFHDAGDLSLFRSLGGAVRRTTPPQSTARRRRGAGMNLSAPFIMRPVATTLLTIGIALAGMLALSEAAGLTAPAGRFSDHSRCTAQLPGASPDTVASSLASRSNATLARSPHVTEMTSTSSLGQTRIILQFDIDRDIDGAARDVEAAINAARVDLPTNLPTNPTYRKVNPADAPILILTLTSKTKTPRPDV